jgi:hypothetical protein
MGCSSTAIFCDKELLDAVRRCFLSMHSACSAFEGVARVWSLINAWCFQLFQKRFCAALL